MSYTARSADMLTQSETRWSTSPFHAMPNSALVAVLANAILSAEPEVDAIVQRLTRVLGRNKPRNLTWIRPLAGRYLQAFDKAMRPRRREVVSFLRQDSGFVAASRKPLQIDDWITGAQTMRPAAAARAWPIPPIETVASLAEWSELTPSELCWFADLKGLGYKHSHSRLQHYHYRVVAKAAGSIRLIEMPKPRLKSLQQRLLSGILDRIPSHPAVHGFVKGRSIRSFAAPHVGQRVVLRIIAVQDKPIALTV